MLKNSILEYTPTWVQLQVQLLLSNKVVVTVKEPPIPFSPFSLADCTMLNHFSFNDFIAIAFPDIAGDLDIQI